MKARKAESLYDLLTSSGVFPRCAPPSAPDEPFSVQPSAPARKYASTFREVGLVAVLFDDLRALPCGWRHGPQNWANKAVRQKAATQSVALAATQSVA